MNRTLKASVDTGNPVRVIRGFKLKSVYAPSTGYRYDGLYHVTKAWMEDGLEGYKVCKYALTVSVNYLSLSRFFINQSLFTLA